MSFAHIPTTTRTKGLRAAWRLGWLALSLTVAIPFADVAGQDGGVEPRQAPLVEAQNQPISAQGQIIGDPSNSLQPHVAADSRNNLHVVWYEGGDAPSVKYAKGVFNGSSYSWGDSVELYVGSGASQYHYPDITVDSQDQVHAVWTWNGVLYYKSWSAASLPITTNLPIELAKNSVYPAIAAGPDNRIHIAWQESRGDIDVMYRELTSSGFTPTQDISNDDINNVSADIAVDSNGNPHVVWYDGISGGKIGYTRRSGGVWTNPIRMGQSPSYFPSIAADAQGCVHLAWGTLGNLSQTVYRKACNGSFENPREVGAANQVRPAVGVSPSGNVVVAWTSKDNVEKLYYVVIRGASTTNVREVAASGTNQSWPDATGLVNGRLILVWQQQQQPSGQYDPFFAYIDACSPNAGVIQQVPERLISPAANHAIYLPLVQKAPPVADC